MHANICGFSICVGKWCAFCRRVRPLRTYRLDFTSWKNLGFNRKSFRPSKARSRSWGPPQGPSHQGRGWMLQPLRGDWPRRGPPTRLGRDVGGQEGSACLSSGGKENSTVRQGSFATQPLSQALGSLGTAVAQRLGGKMPTAMPLLALFLPDQFIQTGEKGPARQRNEIRSPWQRKLERADGNQCPRLLRLLLRWQGEEAGWQQRARPGAGREAKGRPGRQSRGAGKGTGMEKGRGPRSLGWDHGSLSGKDPLFHGTHCLKRQALTCFFWRKSHHQHCTRLPQHS